eukprot:gnl/TRDRNA2_/TRDRNA2_178853_c0_seq1.p1 gnl/TRDRNA2_/TRDRNA2_178853_c0~~gnl/TRDRNA2_/TRDRNA2_178853_c0_seq1.p1  ORF type:complete len:333 (-),score=64.79 gnl/TRDRNA2_/TRDRNA2_178853_c0_seq1:66-1064(-)
MKTLHSGMVALLSWHLIDASTDGEKIIGFDGKPVVYGKPHRPSFYLKRKPQMDISSSHLVHMEDQDHVLAHAPGAAVRGMLHVGRTRQTSAPIHKVPEPVSSGAMVSRRHGRKKPKQMDALSSMRAEICVILKKDGQGDTGCREYMESVCKPGEDMEMDGDPQEVTTARGYCSKFFPDLADEVPPAPPPPPPVEKDRSESDDDDDDPYYSPMAPGPAPGPSPGPFQALREMNEDEPIAEQGFMGEKVEHDDKQTMTMDWNKEFGYGQKGEKDPNSICKKYPGNRWCLVHGYFRRKKHNSFHAEERDESVAAPTSSGLHAIVISGLVLVALAQ